MKSQLTEEKLKTDKEPDSTHRQKQAQTKEEKNKAKSKQTASEDSGQNVSNRQQEKVRN